MRRLRGAIFISNSTMAITPIPYPPRITSSTGVFPAQELICFQLRGPVASQHHSSGFGPDVAAPPALAHGVGHAAALKALGACHHVLAIASQSRDLRGIAGVICQGAHPAISRCVISVWWLLQRAWANCEASTGDSTSLDTIDPDS
jgi:hypothetical protein